MIEDDKDISLNSGSDILVNIIQHNPVSLLAGKMPQFGGINPAGIIKGKHGAIFLNIEILQKLLNV